MSLYDLEEICDGCVKAVFHSCCESFCRCSEENEKYIDDRYGECPYKEEVGE